MKTEAVMRCAICGRAMNLYHGAIILGRQKACRIHIRCGQKADLFKLGLARRVFQRLPAKA